MKQPAKFAEIHPVSWLVGALALIAAAALLRPDHFALGLTKYLPFHTAIETFSIVVAILIFTVGINSYKEKASTNLALLSSAFLAVGLLDFGHTLSYAGMPDFVTASGPEKAIFFWLAARMTAALALLAVAVLPWQKEMAAHTQAAFLATGLALSATIYWIVLFHQDALPRVFDPATGLTPLKRGMEYLLVGIYAASAIIFYRKKQKSQSYNVNLILAAVAVMGLGEFFFASYMNVSDTLNLLGHVYKIIAYYLLYRAIFVQAIRAPYQQLVESARSLRESEERYRMIVETAAEGIWLIDQRQITAFANQKMAEMLGYADATQMIGHPMLDFMAEADKAFAANSLPPHRQSINAQHEFRLCRRDGGELWVNISASSIARDGEYQGTLVMATDITERRHAAQKITELQYRQQLILNNIGDGVCGLDADGLIHFINPAAANMLGYSTDELLGRPLHAISHHTRADGSAYPARECPILGALKHGSHSHINGEIFWRRDSSSFPVEYSCAPVPESDDHNIRLVVTFNDVTMRQQSEQALRHSEARFRTIFDSVGDAIFVHDLNGAIIDINRRACEMYGYSHEEMLDVEVETLSSGIPPYTQANALRWLTQAAGGNAQSFEWQARTRKGRLFWVEVNIRRATIADRDRLLVSARDISERKQAETMLQESEERFRTLFGSIQDAIFVLPTLPGATTGKFIEVNEVACRMLGYTCAELLDMTIADVDDPVAGIDPAPVIQRLMAGESVIFEQVLRARDGRRIAVEVNANPFMLEGRPVVMSLVRDISERRRMEREAHEAHQRQRGLSAHLQTVREEEKANIAREIHDDLGGTLTALKMDLYWLARKLPADREAMPLLERAEAMSLLLDNAVAVTRRVITELRPTIIDDLGLLAAIEWQAAQFHKRTGIGCRVNCIEDKGKLGKECSITLFRILQEALTNVMRHSGASAVDIEFQHSDEEITLSVSDNGCGLPEAHNASPASYGMRGMLERVEHLGGVIKFDNSPGGGLTVTVTLPPQNNLIEETP